MEKYSFSILLPVYSRKRMLQHGDYFFGRSLAKALERAGHRTKLLANADWHKTEPEDISIIIRGRAAPERPLGRLMLEWCISFPPQEETGDFEHIHHFFAASPFMAKRIRRRSTSEKVSIMYQAFDSDVMFPSDATGQNDLVFVGTPRSESRRPVVSFAESSGLPTRIWGHGWSETRFRHMQAGENVENDDLGDIYRSGCVILNDHLAIMKRNKIVSNRVFDGLACGRAVLTDASAGLPDELLPFVYTYADADSFREAAKAALNETPERRDERKEMARQMKKKHCFDARAKQICDKVGALLSDASGL